MHQGSDVDSSTEAAKPEIVMYYNSTKRTRDSVSNLSFELQVRFRSVFVVVQLFSSRIYKV